MQLYGDLGFFHCCIFQWIHFERKRIRQTHATVSLSLQLCTFTRPPERQARRRKRRRKKQWHELCTPFYFCAVCSRSLGPWRRALTANNGTPWQHISTHASCLRCHFAALPWPSPKHTDSESQLLPHALDKSSPKPWGYYFKTKNKDSIK